MAFEDCGGLLNDTGLCTVCVVPQIQIDAGALTQAGIGASVAIPLTVVNNSVVGRPLFVTALKSREGKGDWRDEQLGWERLAANESRPVTITADQLARAGSHSIQILVAVASRWRWRQECYAFTANLSLSIDDTGTGKGPIINIGGDIEGHGNIVNIAGQRPVDRSAILSAAAHDLDIVRAEKEERDLSLRGTGESLWVPRHTNFQWQGFPAQHVPAQGPILTADGILAAGRSKTRGEGGLGDIRLLVQDVNGVLDEDTSRLLSRRHFELYVECDRLILRVTGTGGLRINGDAYGRDKTIELSNGDVISAVVAVPEALKLTVNFQTEHGCVSRVTFSRSPVVNAEVNK